MMRALWLGCRSLFRRESVNDDLDEELQFHIAALTDDHVRAGLRGDAARRRARLELGSVDSIKEARLDAQGVRLVQDVMQDVRFAARQLRRTPASMALALLALALGIGVTTGVFKLIDAVFIRPLPFENAAELYRVAKSSPSGTSQWLTVSELESWQSGTQSTADLAGFTIMDFNLRGPEPEGLLVAWGSRSLLDVLAVSPPLGRRFSSLDFDGGSEKTALISHELWRRRYGGDPGIVGTAIELEGPPFLSDSSGKYTIIGVLPETFWLFYRRTDLVIPMRASAVQLSDPKDTLVETVVARLPRVDPEVVRSNITAIVRRLERESPLSGRGATSVAVTTLREWQFGDMRQPFFFMMGIAGLVAAIASANVALMLTSRTVYRRRELAVRLAIGAAQGRIKRQLVTEAAVLSALGGVAGLLVAAGTAKLAGLLVPSQILNRLPGGVESLVLDRWVVAAALIASVVSGLVSCVGSLVAFQMCHAQRNRRDSANVLPAADRQPLQTVMVVAQTAAAVMLLIAAGLFSRSLSRLNAVDLGIHAPEGLIVWINLNQSRYPTAEERVRFYREVLSRMVLQPEIRHASGVDLPFWFEWQTVRVADDSTTLEPTRWPERLSRSVTPTYFERHGIELVAGRYFSEIDDYRSTPVAIVSQRFADRQWPEVNPVGRQLRVASESGSPVTSTVVGVVKDVRSAPHAEPSAIVYRPALQTPPSWMYVTVEGVGSAGPLVQAIRRAVWSVDPNQPIDGASGGPWTFQEIIAERTERPRLVATIGSALAGLALLLASIGVYGVVSYSVARRTAELGVRIALGATRSRILATVLARTFALTGTGIALGCIAAALGGRFIQAMLFGVTPLDPLTFAAAGLVFILVSLAASWIPARRAIAVDPVAALRAD